MNTIPEVDAYIASRAAWAQPILERLRKAAHASSSRIREEIKWGSPAFTHHGIIATMAAFKNHVSFGFWRAKDLSDAEGLFDDSRNGAMCGMKITSLAEVPGRGVLIAYFKEALALDEAVVKERAAAKKGGKKTTKKKAPKELDVPDWFLRELKKTPSALETFEGFAWSHRRDYVEWVVEAKREDTRKKRVATAVAWLAEGKTRHWKYK